ARSPAVSPPSRRITVIAANRSPDGNSLASVSSRTDSEEPGRNEDSSFFCTSWKRCANEPPSPPRTSHTTMTEIRATRETNSRSRKLTGGSYTLYEIWTRAIHDTAHASTRGSANQPRSRPRIKHDSTPSHPIPSQGG